MGLFNFGVRLSKEDRKLLNDIRDTLKHGLDGKQIVLRVTVEDRYRFEHGSSFKATDGSGVLDLSKSDHN